jgi:hypothetical protein
MKVIRLKSYLGPMKAMGFSDGMMREAETSVLARPDAHPAIPGLRGARKARIARPGMGKRGGGRVVYYFVVERKVLAFLLAYPKNQKDDLTSDDRKAVLRAIEYLTAGETT